MALFLAPLLPEPRFEANDPTGPVWVGIRDGLATWAGDGTSDTAQRDRVRAALIASGFAWPGGRIEVKRAAGPLSDLPIALGILVATGVVDASTPRPTGMLGLDGRIGEAARGGSGRTRSANC